MNLKEALKRIEELENENFALKCEIEELKKMPKAGRRQHDENWTASYNEFIYQYENGHTIVDIVKNGKVSRRTAYRYLEYYRSLNQIAKESKDKEV